MTWKTAHLSRCVFYLGEWYLCLSGRYTISLLFWGYLSSLSSPKRLAVLVRSIRLENIPLCFFRIAFSMPVISVDAHT